MPNGMQRGDHHRRPRPVGAVGDLQRDGAAVGQRRGEHTVGAVLGHQARDVAHERGDVAPLAADHLRDARSSPRTRRSPARRRRPSAIDRNARARPTSEIT